MSDSRYAITYPTAFQVLPDWNMVDGMPEQTQVFCIGEEHDRACQQMWLYNNLPLLVKQGFKTLALEINVPQQKLLEESLKTTSYDPETIGTDAYYGSYFDPVANYKIITKAKELGMRLQCIDHPEADYFGDIDYKTRNKFMAKNLIELAKQQKTIYWGGRDHLYGTHQEEDPDCNIEISVQELLQAEGIKTYSVGMISSLDRFNDYDKEHIFKIDFEAGVDAYIDFLDNSYNIYREKPVTLDLKKFSSLAGTNMPDKLVIFTKQSENWFFDTFQEMKKQGFSGNVSSDIFWNMLEKANPSPVL